MLLGFWVELILVGGGGYINEFDLLLPYSASIDWKKTSI